MAAPVRIIILHLEFALSLLQLRLQPFFLLRAVGPGELLFQFFFLFPQLPDFPVHLICVGCAFFCFF